MTKSVLDGFHAPPKDLLDEETVFSLEDSLDGLPLTPSSRKNDVDSELSLPGTSLGSQSLSGYRRDSRIKPETMLSRVSAFADVSEDITLEQLFEYAWPEEVPPDTKNGPTYYVIQELLADFLKVKSFKRRYPELQRRVCDAYERTWLQEAGLVPSGRAELGLTALLSDEVMSLLRNDFPEVHVVVSDLFRQRRFQRLADHQKRQYEAARIGRGEARAELARKRALESASDFNRQLVAERHKERRCYWDLQTMQIHVPQWPYRLLEPPPHKNGFYPVAVIPGQFTEHFVDFSASELAYMPLSKALYTLPPHLQSKRALRPPPPLPTMLRYGNLTGIPRPQDGGDEGTSRTLQEANQLDNSSTTKPESAATLECTAPKDSEGPAVKKTKREEDEDEVIDAKVDQPEEEEAEVEEKGPPCTVCGRPAADPLRCSQCTRQGHPRCLELPEHMVDVVRTYAWSCMECKQCVECEDTGDEGQMMFCDRCDRGYHAYCVGLRGIPEGNWECPTCDPTSARPPPNRSPSPPPSKRVSLRRRASLKRASPVVVVVPIDSAVAGSNAAATPKRRGRPPKKVDPASGKAANTSTNATAVAKVSNNSDAE
uniref:Phd finger protein 10 n=1 Tax=Echinococcus granulosus TaxID=6210 RepID=A0A068WHU5_ECHGR|nr:phd finger protein 10 [Echinococcus granulosus]